LGLNKCHECKYPYRVLIMRTQNYSTTTTVAAATTKIITIKKKTQIKITTTTIKGVMTWPT